MSHVLVLCQTEPAPGPVPISGLTVEADEAAALVELAKRSHAVITANQDPNVAYPACPTFSAYKGLRVAARWGIHR